MDTDTATGTATDMEMDTDIVTDTIITGLATDTAHTDITETRQVLRGTGVAPVIASLLDIITCGS